MEKHRYTSYFGKTLIFCPNIPLGDHILKSYLKIPADFYFLEIRENLKAQSKCGFS